MIFSCHNEPTPPAIKRRKEKKREENDGDYGGFDKEELGILGPLNRCGG